MEQEKATAQQATRIVKRPKQSELSLIERIQAVSMDIMNMEKDMSVGNGSYGYKAVSDKAVTLAVKRSEKEHGVISIPVKQELIHSEVLRSTPDNNGVVKVTYHDVVKMTVRIYNISNTEDYIDVESFGRGIDNGDKGFGKASTYARKYALLNAYKIATGEDPDAEKSKQMEEQATPEMRKLKVLNYLLSDDDYREKALGHYGHGNIDDLTDGEIYNLATNLEKKKLI